MKHKQSISLFLGAVITVLCLGISPARAEIEATAAWARATAAGAQQAGIFFTIKNTGPGADVLMEAATPAADDSMLHKTVTQTNNGVTIARMEMLDQIVLPVGQTETLAPGSVHLMLTGLHAPLQEGQSFPLTLSFAHHAPITVTVHVAAAGANQAPQP